LKRSLYRTVQGRLSPSDRTEWRMPEMDRNMDFPFRKGPVDLDAILPMVTPLLARRRTCIQAGGCVGVWPLLLAPIFERVITFEPEPVNFRCLRENTAGVANIQSIHAALWSTSTDRVQMGLDDKYYNNCGAYFVRVSDEGIRTMRIDDLNETDVDLLCLDVEGAEYDAILGAADTLARCSPVIAMEDKAHHERFQRGSPVELLCEMGYRVTGRPTPWDVVLAK
jgi:FkbM family methyltransferase